MWAAYNNVAQHQTVNHSIEFVNSATGVHTQHIESYWNRVKTKIKKMKGCHDQMISSYLDEFMWRERHGRTASAALQSLCRDIARTPVSSVIVSSPFQDFGTAIYCGGPILRNVSMTSSSNILIVWLWYQKGPSTTIVVTGQFRAQHVGRLLSLLIYSIIICLNISCTGVRLFGTSRNLVSPHQN